jgi:drug/metabolite transporter (DMT)-like permease
VRRNYLTLVAVCTFWGSIPLVVRKVDLPPGAIVLVRVWVAAAGLAAVLAVRRAREAGPPLFSHEPRRSIFAGLLLAVHWTTMFAAYQKAPSDTVVFIVFLAPLGVAAVAPRLLGEHVDRRTIGALALAIAGLALVAGPSLWGSQAFRSGSASGMAWAALSAVTFVALVLLSKPLAEVYGGLRLALIEMLVAGVALLPLALIVDWGTPSPLGWAALVALGLLHTAVAISLYLSTLARIPATHAGILGYLEPAAVVALAWLVLSETPRLTTVLGGAMIVVAGGLVILRTGVPTHVPG